MSKLTGVTTAERFARAKYVSLTTYRKDGTPVATPVWLAVDGGELFIVSDADAWKVKRIRKTSRVSLAVCDVRGRVAPDAVRVDGTARVLDDAGTQHVRRLIARKYLMSRVGNWAARVLHLPKKPVVGIAVTF
ncbi:PPOX class F420-dependent oxidoreductase [Catellatospora citrea]|uniref:PPOX class F420-dependent oxidoreductase n=1 Tax=Catellatospora citrea TaxID=53366 RepID=UPI0033F8C4A3